MESHALDLTEIFPIRYAVPINGYLSPTVIMITLIANFFVIIVLLQKHMRSPTNAILAGMAISDMLTGVFPLPIFVYFFGLGYYKEYVPYGWCHTFEYFSGNLPTIFHTVSVWLTMMLAIQRYIYICHPLKARTWTVCKTAKIVRGIVALFIIAFLSHVLNFLDKDIIPFDLPSKLNNNANITGCVINFKPWFKENSDVYHAIYFWFRVICIHLIPCITLLVLNALLIVAMKTAQMQRLQLLNQNKDRESKQLQDTNRTTLMLVVVVGLFLLVELPTGIIMSIHIIDELLDLSIFGNTAKNIITLTTNFVILLSYPCNFLIYCGMSRKFRDTFKRMLTRSPVSLGV